MYGAPDEDIAVIQQVCRDMFISRPYAEWEEFFETHPLGKDFVGSPVQEEEAALVKLGKKLKKNSVAMDIINFGEEAPRAADTAERRKGEEGPRGAADTHREEGGRRAAGAAGSRGERPHARARPPRAPAGGERRQARGAAQRRQL